MSIIISDYNNGEWLFTDVYNNKLYRHNDESLEDFCRMNDQNYFIILNNAKESASLIWILSNLGIQYYEYDRNLSGIKDNGEISEILTILHRIENNIGNNNSNKGSFLSSFTRPSSERNIINNPKQLAELSKIEAQIMELSEKFSRIEYIVNELYNQDSNHDEKSNVVIEELRRELSSYKNDFYLKSMQKYGVDIAIKIMDRLYIERRDIEQSDHTDSELLDRYNKLIDFCTSEFKRLNLKFTISSTGDAFDGERMVSYEDYVETDDISLAGCVAESVSPAVSWTLPRIDGVSKAEIILKEEIVVLYKTN